MDIYSELACIQRQYETVRKAIRDLVGVKSWLESHTREMQSRMSECISQIECAVAQKDRLEAALILLEMEIFANEEYRSLP